MVVGSAEPVHRHLMLAKPSTCSGCVLEHSGQGFMAPSGKLTHGVMLVGEALGADEVPAGLPFIGKAGQTLNRILQRGGLNRDDFLVANSVWCRPPNNELSGTPYEAEALRCCAPYLDRLIADTHPRCIVALGAVAARRLLPNLPVGILEARGYVFPYQTSDGVDIWCVPTVHPAFIMRGKTAWAQVLLYDIQHAIEIARV